MNYVIFDLEWNRYARAVKRKCPDEIIEFGAVKADNKLSKIGEFRRLVKPALYKKIEPTIEEMTGLTYQRLESEGEDFSRAMREFREFIGKEPAVLIAWGIHDSLVLRSNCLYYNPNMRFDWLRRFVDLQYYASRNRDKPGDFNQLGLATAAGELGIPYVADDLHDALVDASLTYEVFRRIYDKQRFEACMLDVSDISADKHPYKAVSVTDPKSPLVDRRAFRVRCPKCGRFARRKSGWRVKGNKFIARHHCATCGTDLLSSVSITVRAHDDVRVKQRVRMAQDMAQPARGGRNAKDRL